MKNEPDGRVGDAPSDTDAEQALHIHRPKPLHGLREVLGEIGIIVVGILIALALEQGVEAIRFWHEAAEARASLRQELGANEWRIDQRLADEPCIVRQLNALQVRLDEARDTGRYRRPKPFGHAWGYTWEHGRWDAAIASGQAAHLPSDELQAYATVYAYFVSLQATSLTEKEALHDLRVLADLNRLSPDDLSRGYRDIEIVREGLPVWKADIDHIRFYTANLHLRHVSPVGVAAMPPSGACGAIEDA